MFDAFFCKIDKSFVSEKLVEGKMSSATFEEVEE